MRPTLDPTAPNPYKEIKEAILDRLAPLEGLGVAAKQRQKRVEAGKKEPRAYLFVGLRNQKFGKPDGTSDLIQQSTETVFGLALGLADADDIETITGAIAQLLTGFKPPHASEKGYLSSINYGGSDGKTWQWAIDFTVPLLVVEWDELADEWANSPGFVEGRIKLNLPDGTIDASQQSIEARDNLEFVPKCCEEES
ncbi:MAG: Gp37 family protein [Cyanobacteria bacterium P01_E01_bin.42]